MNSITRLILHRVAAGKVPLTPQVLEILKEVSDDHARNPTAVPGEPFAPAHESGRETPAEPRPGFLSSTGRWLNRVSYAFLLLVGAVMTAAAGNFETANEAFARGQYAEAARGYEMVMAQQGYSAPLLFNLANAQQRNGELGRAILNYERAALLAPNDPDIAANLAVAREKAGIEIGRPAPLQHAVRRLTLNVWFGGAALAAFVMAATLPLQRLRPAARVVMNVGRGLATLALVFAVGALALRGSDFRRAVVIAPEAVAGVSPVTVAPPVFKLRAGEGVTLQRTHGEFALIRNQAGHEGWVKADDIARVIPAGAKFPGS